MLTQVRKFLSQRISLARAERDRLLQKENLPLLEIVVNNVGASAMKNNRTIADHSEKLAIQIAVVNELVRVANFLDLFPTEITNETKDEEKVYLTSNILIREYLEWLETNKVSWNKVEELLTDEDLYTDEGMLSGKVAFATIAMIAKGWYIAKQKKKK